VKPLKFIGSSEDDLSSFPKEAKGAAGHELWQEQLGLMPSDWKPMPNVSAGAFEVRIHIMGEWRAIYVAKFADAVYVLHAFQKKTQRTRKEDVALAAARYKQLKEIAK
jgi:phage-related protein